MNPIASDPNVQFVAWGIGLIELILGLYILFLNYRHTANRHSSALFFLFALNSFAIGLLVGAGDAAAGQPAAAFLAATIPAFGPALLLVAIVLLKPEWLKGRFRWGWRLLYLFALLPMLLTVLDYFSATNLWFSGLDPQIYQGGFTELANYTSDTLGWLRPFILIFIPVLSLLPLGYLAFFDRRLPSRTRRLALLLLTAQLVTVIGHVWLPTYIQEPLVTMMTSAIYFVVYTYASFFNIISERRTQTGRLQVRITLLIVAITVPLLAGSVVYIGTRANDLLLESAQIQLQDTNQAVAENANTWLDLNNRALQQMVNLPGIISMDPQEQRPILQALAQAFPHMYLVSTTDLGGLNVARNDDADLTDYSDRSWYQQAVAGEPIAFQTLVGRTSGQPALVVSQPIKNELGEIVGVGMYASDLDEINRQVGLARIGETGLAYVIDANNRVVAHPDPAYTSELRDLGTYPPVMGLRAGLETPLVFSDEDGVRWVAYMTEIDYGWGVVVQQQESEIFAAANAFRLASFLILGLGSGLLIALTGLAIWQAIRPIHDLTDTATAISGGDLSRLAPVQSQDEIGELALAFNRMTEQLLELIGGLEQGVAERTHDLEQRSRQLQATAEVGQAAATYLDMNELIARVADLIQERFDLYYVGLFLVDEMQEWAVLRAGTGTAGQAMLARQHMIRIGEGMIGWSVANAHARVALQAGEDAVRLATAELPETRSEAAIPLRSRNRVLGALSVQSTQVGAFDDETIAILQTMADLVAVAIDNARLYSETEVALQSTRRAYGELSRQAWLELISTKRQLSFRSDRSGTVPLREDWYPAMRAAWLEGRSISPEADGQTGNGDFPLAVPIRVRDNVIGVIHTHKSRSQGRWTEEEIKLVESVIEQLGVTLDSARLYEETQKQAQSERLIGEVTARMRQTLDIESVLKAATRELRTALDLAEVEIRMGTPRDQNG
ncbi:MAG: GAF domain-containing protein [Anaerolineales bacterium]|nr:GAF domain-containing protein [Anaerolineales bacterium]